VLPSTQLIGLFYLQGIGIVFHINFELKCFSECWPEVEMGQDQSTLLQQTIF